LAYVFYTSGSTGVPKGAMVERAGMRNHLQAKIGELRLGASDVVAQNASHCFDISVWQMLAALMVGGGVAIYGEDMVLEPARLVEALLADQVTVLEVVPSYLELLLSLNAVQHKLDRLRFLVSNAETLPVALTQRWLQTFPTVKLINTWGSTECSDDVTHETVEREIVAMERIGVGRPITGARVYVVGEDLELLPAGCVGEIAVGGVCVGRGYLHDAVKTAPSFIPDPFAPQPGARLYLTGDMGRWRWDGGLDFLGRRDGQVKLRGRRVEMGEVAGALSSFPGVKQAAASIKADRLVGYWVGDREISPSKLRRHLEARLPEHMLPDALVRLDELPLTRTGKINLRALPEPDWNIEDADLAPPRTELEQQIAAIWQEVLGVERVGLHHNFFDLGGHSLNGTKIVMHLRQRLGCPLSLRELFLNPSVAQLGAALQAYAKPVFEAEEIPRLPDQPSYDLAPVQVPMWIQFREILQNETRSWVSRKSSGLRAKSMAKQWARPWMRSSSGMKRCALHSARLKACLVNPSHRP
jgi:amino acid adenylation domain-containing protein